MIRCKLCNGINIEQKVWCDANTDTPLDAVSDCEIMDNWCRDCEKHVEFVESNE